MKIKNQLTLQRLIGKIDNDFNISESDWIPRVAAWTIDALSQMQVLPMERKRRKLEVSDRIAQFPCEINGKELRVFDKRGCEIPALDSTKSCKCSGFGNANSEIAVFNNSSEKNEIPMDIGTIVSSSNRRTFVLDGKTIEVNFDTNEIAVKTNEIPMDIGTIVQPRNGRNFVLDGNNIELNFDTDEIEVETYEVATYHDDYFDCECPYIYDNGLLLEALAWYCLFKYLSRGSKHPVYDLKSNSPITNPWLQWNNLKVKAANSVKIEISKDLTGWNNFFYNNTFLPRN